MNVFKAYNIKAEIRDGELYWLLVAYKVKNSETKDSFIWIVDKIVKMSKDRMRVKKEMDRLCRENNVCVRTDVKHGKKFYDGLLD